MPARSRAFAFAVLPDTQIYARYHPELFLAQTRWLADEASALRLAFVVHVGDVTDTSADAEWAVARRAFDHLERARVPYLVAPGNHDLGPGGTASSRETRLDLHFPHDSSADGATFEPGAASNRWTTVETPAGPWTVLGLEFAPRVRVLDWARAALAARPDAPAVVVSHAHLYSDGTRYDVRARADQAWSPHAYGIARDGEPVADGAVVFDRLVAPSPNVRFVVCGHVLNEGAARLTTLRPDGTRVHELLANYQHRDRGGNGRLRLVTVDPDTSEVRVRTYSPVSGRAEVDDRNDFRLRL